MKLERWILIVAVAATIFYLLGARDRKLNDREAAHQDRVDVVLAGRPARLRWADSLKTMNEILAGQAAAARARLSAQAAEIGRLRADLAVWSQHVPLGDIDSTARSIGLRRVTDGVWGSDSNQVRELARQLLERTVAVALVQLQADRLADFARLVAVQDRQLQLLTLERDSLAGWNAHLTRLLEEDRRIHGCKILWANCPSRTTSFLAGALAGVGVVVAAKTALQNTSAPRYRERADPQLAHAPPLAAGFSQVLFLPAGLGRMRPAR